MNYTSNERGLLNAGKMTDARLVNGKLRYVIQTITVPSAGIAANGDIQLVDLPGDCVICPNGSFITHDGVGAATLTLYSTGADGEGAYSSDAGYAVSFTTTTTAGKVDATAHVTAGQMPRVKPSDEASERCLSIGLHTSAALTAGKKIALHLAVMK